MAWQFWGAFISFHADLIVESSVGNKAETPLAHKTHYCFMTSNYNLSAYADFGDKPVPGSRATLLQFAAPSGHRRCGTPLSSKRTCPTYTARTTITAHGTQATYCHCYAYWRATLTRTVHYCACPFSVLKATLCCSRLMRLFSRGLALRR